MWKARELRELAMKGKNSDKIINGMDSTIVILETTAQKAQAEADAKVKDLTDKLKAEQDKTADVWGIANSYKGERDSLKKEVKKSKLEKGLLALGLLLSIIAGFVY